MSVPTTTATVNTPVKTFMAVITASATRASYWTATKGRAQVESVTFLGGKNHKYRDS